MTPQTTAQEMARFEAAANVARLDMARIRRRIRRNRVLRGLGWITAIAVVAYANVLAHGTVELRRDNDVAEMALLATPLIDSPAYAGAVPPKQAPVPEAGATLRMDATTYHAKYAGRRTASGERYRPERLTAASNRHAMGKRLSVAYRGRSVAVRVNDRLASRYSHRIDLSRAAWRRLTNNAAPSVARGVKVREVGR